MHYKISTVMSNGVWNQHVLSVKVCLVTVVLKNYANVKIMFLLRHRLL